MKKLVFVFLMGLVFQIQAQNAPKKSQANFELGSGLTFNFNDSSYIFKLGGMVQPYIGIEQASPNKTDYFLNSKRSYFNFQGYASDEKVGFFIQLDYSLTTPLLDAWVGYYPFSGLSIVAGQKQNITNNREMLFMEDQLQFANRSLLSNSFSRSGREMGIFIDYKIGKSIGIVPQISITSGDGRNSFGIDSRDADLGGFKYAGRLDVYPLGFFSDGNEKLVADVMHEQTPKFVVGAAASYNDGASNAVGEGHGDIILYNQIGSAQYPDYRQLNGDILLKYQGFSVLGEYKISTATKLEGSYKDEFANELLLPTEIADFLSLGSGFNVQLGYVTTSGYALDFRFSEISAEFINRITSVIQDQTQWTVGATKYFKGNNLKINASFSALNSPGNLTTPDLYLGEVLFQVRF